MHTTDIQKSSNSSQNSVAARIAHGAVNPEYRITESKYYSKIAAQNNSDLKQQSTEAMLRIKALANKFKSATY